MTYRQRIFKRNLELIGMFPFVLLGRIAGTLFPLRTKHRIFLFFPSADIGGSVKVNIDITACIREQQPLIIFSKKPKNNQFLSSFEAQGIRIIDLHRYIDNKLYHFVNFFFRGVLAAWINRVDNPVVFGGESIFFYKMLPHVKKQAKRIDLCHLNTWIAYSLAFVPYLDVRIFSTPAIRRDVRRLYDKWQLPAEYYERLLFIDNKVDIPPYERTANSQLQVIYVGRGAPQKRVHIIAEIARRLHDAGVPVQVSFVGDVERVIRPADYPFCTFYGNVREKERLSAIYQGSDVLLLTSAYEGLPIAIMEMMAHAKVAVSTAVDGIPDYITDGENGFLLENHPNEKQIEDDAIKILSRLAANRSLLEEVGQKSRQYAIQHFSGTVFCEHYCEILLQPKSNTRLNAATKNS
ncbi:MAG TPA: glycosyltransferase family 4 protein [Chitinophagaceae bacterium]